jgi:hypothetical protein
MTTASLLAFVLQLIALFPTLEPAFVQAVRDFNALFNSGNVTDEDAQKFLNDVIARIQSQSAMIQDGD